MLTSSGSIVMSPRHHPSIPIGAYRLRVLKIVLADTNARDYMVPLSTPRDDTSESYYEPANQAAQIH